MNTFSDFRAINYEKYSWLCDAGFANWVIENIKPYGNSILDIGCGNGFMLPYYEKKFNHTAAIEPCEALYQQITDNPDFQNVVIKKAAAEEIPFPDLSYDIVLSKSSLHHFVNVEVGLKEMLRVARNVIAVIEVVAPSEDCIPFLKEILLQKEKARSETSIYTTKSLKDTIKLQTKNKIIFQLYYDQYIDVADWLTYSDLETKQKDTLFRYIQECKSDIKHIMQIHFRAGRLVMLRRMCLNIIFLT